MVGNNAKGIEFSNLFLNLEGCKWWDVQINQTEKLYPLEDVVTIQIMIIATKIIKMPTMKIMTTTTTGMDQIRQRWRQ